MLSWQNSSLRHHMTRIQTRWQVNTWLLYVTTLLWQWKVAQGLAVVVDRITLGQAYFKSCLCYSSAILATFTRLYPNVSGLATRSENCNGRALYH
jgi:hypothetical protein